MEDSYRDAVCTRIVSLASTLAPSSFTVPAPPRVVERVVSRHVLVPKRIYPYELAVAGLLIGVVLVIAVDATYRNRR